MDIRCAETLFRHQRYGAACGAATFAANSRCLRGGATTICPAPSHAVDLDLAELREPSFKVEPPAFHLHSWFPGEEFGAVVTHQIPIGTLLHPFFGPDGKLL